MAVRLAGPHATENRPQLDRSFWLVTGGAIAVLAVAAVWVSARIGGEVVTAAVDAGVTVLAATGASLACFLRARRHEGGARRGWQLLGTAAACWSLAALTAFAFDVILGLDLPDVSFADVVALLAIPFAAAGLLALADRGARLSRARALLDGLLVACSVLFVSWAFVLAPLWHEGGAATSSRIVALAYPISDVVLVVVTFVALTRTATSTRTSMMLLAAGMLLYAIADSLYAYLVQVQGSTTGSALDLGWIAGYLCIALAALAPALGSTGEDTTERAADGSRAELLLPYVPLTLAMLAAVWLGPRALAADGVLTWLAATLGGLVLVRQLVVLVDNRALARDLEAKVVARTAELAGREAWFRSLVQNSSDVITVVDEGLEVVFQSPSIIRVYGGGPDEAVGRKLLELAEPSETARLLDGIEQARAKPGVDVSIECRLRHADGSLRHSEIMITSLLHDPNVRGIVLNSRDITERKQLEEQLVVQAFHDSLTGLANRGLFRDRLEHALARIERHTDQPLAVLFIDVDGFKAINDSLGHSAGDRLLMALAARIWSDLRPSDTFARLGGDEFAILMDEPSEDRDAAVVAERVLTRLLTPFHIRGHNVVITASIGVATSNTARNAEELLRNADTAMYSAKARGKNRFEFFEPEMHVAALARLELESDLRRALERGGELDVHYQALNDLSNCRLIGAEALVRWQHPTRGPVPPEVVIPIAEETGLIIPLGKWVLAEACRQASEWSAELTNGRRFTIGVNLSARQLQHPHLVRDVAEILFETGLDPATLVLEMTESVLMDDTDAAVSRLAELRKLGVLLAIDDFGTGYSSLSYLQRFDVDILKIDRSFVQNIKRRSDRHALARSIVELGRNFRLETIAEGIETPEELEQIREMGCELGQGFFFAEPMHADAFGTLLRRASVTR